jgi:hypothetical protein
MSHLLTVVVGDELVVVGRELGVVSVLALWTETVDAGVEFVSVS